MPQYSNIKSRLILIAILLVAGNNCIAQTDNETWNHKIIVKSEKAKYEGKTFHTYSIIVYEATHDSMQSVISKQIAVMRDNRMVKEDILKSMQVQVPKLDMSDIDIRVKAQDVEASDDVLIEAVFINKKYHVNPDKFPEADVVAKALMYDFSVRLNRAVIEEEIEEAVNALASLEDNKMTYEGQQENSEKNLVRVDLRLAGLQEEQLAISKRLRDEKDNLTALKKPVDGSRATREELIAYDAALKYITEIEELALKNRMETRQYEEKKSELTNSIQENKKVIDGMPERVNNQKNLIRLLQLQLESVE